MGGVRMIEKQKQFFYTGKTLNLKFRIQSLQRLEYMIQKKEIQIKDALYKDLGKSKFESYATEIGLVLKEIKEVLGNIRKWSAEKKVKTPWYLHPAQSTIQKEPYGVVLVLGPYNYPFQLTMLPLIGAIAAGNCVVVKPSELTPCTSKIIEEIINKVFTSNHVLCVQGEVEVTTQLLKQPFDYIFFTGSPKVGRIVMKKAAKQLIPVTLELGGKSPVIIEKTADLKKAAKKIIWGKLLNAGQTCIAPDYVLVKEEYKKELLDEMQYAVKRFYGEQIETNSDFGRVVNKRHMLRLRQILENDVQYICYGGKYSIEQNYIQPTILDIPWEKRFDAAAMQEEIFGPILPVIAYKNLKDVIPWLRQKEKPLALYIFTKNRKIGRWIMKQIPSGGVTINDTVMHCINPNLPFGGIGNSGVGKYHGKYSFDTFTHERGVFYMDAKVSGIPFFPPYTPWKYKVVEKVMTGIK